MAHSESFARLVATSTQRQPQLRRQAMSYGCTDRQTGPSETNHHFLGALAGLSGLRGGLCSRAGLSGVWVHG